MDTQLGLFPDLTAAPRPPAVGPAEPSAELQGLAARLPREVRLGTSSWSFPGWHSLVYDRVASESVLASDGLTAYAAHPLLRSVCVDRSFYRPLSVEQLEAYASAVPDDFRFVVKADRLVTSPLDPETAMGVRARNPHFLDAAYATAQVVRPLIEGMGSKAGALLFQFPPMPASLVGGRAAFLERLQRFLEALPAGPAYALELRTPSFLTRDYVDLLDATGAAHCYNVHPAMCSLARQLEAVQPFYQPVLLVRWMLAGLEREAARLRYEPFDRLVDEDRATRDLVARTALDALLGEREVIVIASNEAEGAAPLTLLRLAERIAGWGSGGD